MLNLLELIPRGSIVFPLACALSVGMLLISEGSYWRSVDALTELGQINETRTRLDGLQETLRAAEAGQRGYLLTGKPEFLQPFDAAVNELDATFSILDPYYGDRPERAAVLGKLRTLTYARVAEMAQSIRQREEAQRGAKPGIAMPNPPSLDGRSSDVGGEQMRAIRAATAELLSLEDRSRTAGRSELSQTLRYNRIGVAALSILSLLALFLYQRQTSAHRLQQADLRRTVQAERDRLDIEVQRRTAQLTDLTQYLQNAREDERSRLARDLHDELGALLTSAKLDAARIKSRLAGTSPEALERLAHLVETLNQSIALGRSIIEDLRPSTLSNLGLLATLEIMAREFTDRSGIQVHCTLTPVKLAAAAELTIYRLTQEAITNISKYAKANHMWLALDAQDGWVRMVLRDDGIGFNTQGASRSAYGLVGMRFRVEAAGGKLVVISQPGHGTQIIATLPESSNDAAPKVEPEATPQHGTGLTTPVSESPPAA